MDIRAIHDLQGHRDKHRHGVLVADNAEFKIFVTNQGNIEEEVEVLTSDSLRVDRGRHRRRFQTPTRQDQRGHGRATPPSELIADDEYTFTVIVSPKGMPVAGPLTSVVSKVGRGTLSDTQRAVAIVIIVGTLGVAFLFMRTRPTTG